MMRCKGKEAILQPQFHENKHQLNGKKYKKCCSGSGWVQRSKMGRESQFGKPIHFTLDHVTRRLVGRIFAYLGGHEDGRIIAKVCGENITIDQMLIAHEFGASVEGVVNAANMLVKEAQTALKNIAGMDAFVNKEQWSVICMKEEFHVKFVTSSLL